MKRKRIMRWIAQAGLLAALAAIPAVAVALWHPNAPQWRQDDTSGITEIPMDAARGLLPDVVWVDARSRHEFDNGHIAGAVWLYEGEWESLLDGFLDAWDGNQMVVVYCGAGDCKASQSVAMRLKQEVGVEKIVVLRGGWDGRQP